MIYAFFHRTPAITALVLTVLMGCERSPETLCQDFPQIEKEFEIAKTDLKAPRGRKGRKVASQSLKGAWDAEAQEDWLEWIETVLEKTYWAKDLIEYDPVRRHALAPLSRATTALVTMHGYVEKGNPTKVLSLIGQARKELRTVYEEICFMPGDAGAGEKSARKPAAVKDSGKKKKQEKGRKSASKKSR